MTKLERANAIISEFSEINQRMLARIRKNSLLTSGEKTTYGCIYEVYAKEISFKMKQKLEKLAEVKGLLACQYQ